MTTPAIGHSPRPGTAGPEPLSLVHLFTVLLRYRVSIVLLAAAAMALTVGLGLIAPRTWTSSASFIPQSRRGASNLEGIAAQFGVAVPTADAGQSPAFYASLVSSREVLGKIMKDPVKLADGRSITLAEFLEVKDQEPRVRDAETMRRLARKVDAANATKTGVVSVAVHTRSPEVSQQVATRLIDEINRFNLSTRRSQATAERQFTEQRLREAKDSLRAAENALSGFLAGNRGMGGSPYLQGALERLRRDVEQRQEVYVTLSQAYEQARIEEVRDTPVITLLEAPNLPVRPDPRGLVSRGLLAGLVGALLGILLAFIRDALAAGRRLGDSSVAELSRLGAETVADLRHPIGALRRAARSD
jgi:uncharacterized protein involved in exopolysaccharide biosynthesis